MVIAYATTNGFGLSLWSASTLCTAPAQLDEQTSSPPAYDGQGHCIALWSEQSSTTATVMVSRSADDGATWTAPARLFSGDGTSSNTNPMVATDTHGNWLAVWSSNDPLSGTKGLDSDILISRSTDAGASWTTPTLLNSNGTADFGSDTMPCISTDRNGTWLVAWTSTNPNDATTQPAIEKTWYSRSVDAGLSWSMPASFLPTASTTRQLRPKVLASGAGRFVLASSNIRVSPVPSSIELRVTTDGGQAWQTVASPNTGTANSLNDVRDYAVDLATDRNLHWTLAWMACSAADTTSPSHIYTSRSSDDGSTWQPPVALATTNDPQYFPHLCTDTSGTWVMTLADVNSAFKASIAVSTDNGATWQAGPWPSEAIGNSSFPYYDYYSNEFMTFAWPRSDGNWNAVFTHATPVPNPGGYPASTLVIAHTSLFRPPVDTAWGLPRTLPWSVPGTTITLGYGPFVATDNNYNWIIAYTSTQGANGETLTDSEIMFSLSKNNALTWSSPAVLNSDAALETQSDSDPYVACDNSGNCLCVWLRGTGSSTQLMLARSSNAGQSWTYPTPLASTSDPSYGTEQQVAWLGGQMWDVVYSAAGGTAIRQSTDGGATWSSEGIMDHTIYYGSCGNSCSYTAYSAPTVCAAPNGTIAHGRSRHDYSRTPLGTQNDSMSDSAGLVGNWGATTKSFSSARIFATDRTGNWFGLGFSSNVATVYQPAQSNVAIVRSVNDGQSFVAAPNPCADVNARINGGQVAMTRPALLYLALSTSGYQNLAYPGTPYVLTFVSTDVGQSYSAPAKLQGTVPGLTTYASMPQLAGSVNGRVVAVWSASAGANSSIWFATRGEALASADDVWLQAP